MSEEMNKTHKLQSFSKITINLTISVILIVAIFLIGIFIVEDYKPMLANKNFWIQKCLLGGGAFTIMLAIANVTEERRKKLDKNYIKRINAIDTNYTIINTNHQTAQLEQYIESINKQNKYKAYVFKLKKKLAKTKDDSKKELIEKKLLCSVEEVWQGVDKVKYKRISYDQIFSGAVDLRSNEQDSDLEIHKFRYALQKMTWKILTIIAIGCITGDISFTITSFTIDMIVPYIFKTFTILMSIYTGICFGYFIMDRTQVVLKRKTKILSDFDRRVQNNESLELEVQEDVTVQKIKEKMTLNEAVKEATNNTFGSGKPVKAGTLCKEIANNLIGG